MFRFITPCLIFVLGLSACEDNGNPIVPEERFEAGPILFVSDKSGTSQLYSMNEDGSDVKQLTHDPNFPIGDARWSPDGSKIAYTSRDDRVDIRRISSAIYIMNANGTGKYKLTNPPVEAFSYPFDSAPVWSPDQRRIAFSRLMPPEVAGDFDIFVIDLNGQNEQKITSNRNLTEIVAGWTPDGRYLLVDYGDYSSGKSQIAFVDLEGNYVQIVSHPDSSETAPSLSPNGLAMAFTKRGALYVMDRDGANRRKLHLDPLPANILREWAISWSGDGTRILYNSEEYQLKPFENPPRNIFLIDTTGTTKAKITPFDYREAYFYATSWRRR
jgi:Tol biopolymer transport system component